MLWTQGLIIPAGHVICAVAEHHKVTRHIPPPSKMRGEAPFFQIPDPFLCSSSSKEAFYVRLLLAAVNHTINTFTSKW